MIDTNYLRDRCNISRWLHDQFKIEIKELCDAYDEQQREIASLKLIVKDNQTLMYASYMGQIAREKLADENIKLRKALKDLLDFAEDEIQENWDYCTHKFKQVILNAREILK